MRAGAVALQSCQSSARINRCPGAMWISSPTMLRQQLRDLDLQVRRHEPFVPEPVGREASLPQDDRQRPGTTGGWGKRQGSFLHDRFIGKLKDKTSATARNALNGTTSPSSTKPRVRSPRAISRRVRPSCSKGNRRPELTTRTARSVTPPKSSSVRSAARSACRTERRSVLNPAAA
jgi:hypothetical protein